MKLEKFFEDELQVAPGSAAKIPIKSLVEQNRDRYEKLKSDPKKRFKHTIYKIPIVNRTIVHVKVPSETVTNFYYDVLVELESSSTDPSSLFEYDVKVFSNCPSFVFTYAYVFYHFNADTSSQKNKSGMIIDDFDKKIPKERLLVSGAEDKLSDEVLDNKPVVRNRFGLPLFDKSLYQAVFYLEETIKVQDIKRARTYRTAKQIFDSVTDFDVLMAQRQRQVNKDKVKAPVRKRTVQPKEKAALSKTRSSVSVVKPKAPLRAVTTKKPNKPKK